MTKLTNEHDRLLWFRDAQRAYDTFAAGRNLFFVMILLSLVILIAAFWVVNCGLLDGVLGEMKHDQSPSLVQRLGGATLIAAAVTVSDGTTDSETEDMQTPEDDSDDAGNTAGVWAVLTRILLAVVNAILPFVVVLYAVTIWVGLQLSLTGRLGGLQHNARAFFLSLILLVLVLPWGRIVAFGTWQTLFGYHELASAYVNRPDSGDGWNMACYYGRFLLLQIVALLAVLGAQIRCVRGGMQINRRGVQIESIAVGQQELAETEEPEML